MSLENTIRRAKSRLTDMVINEVSLVDAAANLRKFVLIKSKDGNMPNAATQKMTLKLPTAAKSALMDGIGKAIDKVTALASVVGDAETDDAATVPAELATALTQVGEMFTGMATQYGGASTAAAGADNAPAGTDAPSETPPGTNPAPPMGKSADTDVTKALPVEMHDGDSIKTMLHDGDSLKTLLHKTVGAAYIELGALARLDKAGRKMAGARYKKLSELHDSLGKLLNELAYDESAEAKGAMDALEAEKAKKPPPPPPKKDDAAPPAPAAKVAKANETPELASALALMQEMKSTLDTQAKKIDAQAQELAAISKVQGVSNAGSVDGPKDLRREDGGVQWAPDMSEAVAKKNSKANGSANGARA